MHDFRKGLIIGALRKVLKRVHLPLEVMLTCPLERHPPVEPCNYREGRWHSGLPQLWRPRRWPKNRTRGCPVFRLWQLVSLDQGWLRSKALERSLTTLRTPGSFSSSNRRVMNLMMDVVSLGVLST